MKISLHHLPALLLTAGALVSPAQAIGFLNGDFEGYTGNKNTHNSAVPPGWTTTNGTPDVFNAATNFAYTWAPSANGGDFLHGIGWQPSWTESAIQPGVDGLTIGSVYEISFEQSISNGYWSETGGYWRIKFGDEIQDSPWMTLPELGIAAGWTWHTMYFTATAASQRLEVIAWSDTDGLRADLAIDGFYLGAPRPNPPGANVQAPAVPDLGATSPLLLIALGLLATLRARRSRTG